MTTYSRTWRKVIKLGCYGNVIYRCCSQVSGDLGSLSIIIFQRQRGNKIDWKLTHKVKKWRRPSKSKEHVMKLYPPPTTGCLSHHKEETLPHHHQAKLTQTPLRCKLVGLPVSKSLSKPTPILTIQKLEKLFKALQRLQRMVVQKGPHIRGTLWCMQDGFYWRKKQLVVNKQTDIFWKNAD